MKHNANALPREILLAFWKVHILHHAGEEPIYGQWIVAELRRHGYEISPGTLYPLLRRMEAHGWLNSERPGNGPRSPRYYRLTRAGQEVLELVRIQLRELCDEVLPKAERKRKRKAARD